jgi:hypothetical protein
VWGGPCADTGAFVVLYDEEAEREAERVKEEDKHSKEAGARRASVRAEWR